MKNKFYAILFVMKSKKKMNEMNIALKTMLIWVMEFKVVVFRKLEQLSGKFQLTIYN